MKKAKQIGFLTAIMISVGSTIGAGIFFKNGAIFTNSGGSLAFTIATWLISFIGILAIGIALIEVTSANKDNGGIVEWVRKFAPKRMSKFSGSYMLLIFLPLNYLALPIYAVMSLTDAIQTYDPSFVFEGYQTALIGFGFFLWLATMAFFKFNASKKLQWLFTVLKFLPMILIIIFALMHVSDHGVEHSTAPQAVGLTGFFPWLGIMASIPAIMFAVDGFYLKEPKKLGVITAISVSVIMGSYLIFAVITATTGKGSYMGIDFLRNPKHKSVMLIINVSISMAVLGIVNGFAMATYNMYESIDEKEKLGIVKWFRDKFKINNNAMAAFIVSIVLGTLSYILLTPIAILWWKASGYSFYGSTSANLFEMMDLITNFTSLFIFIFIGIAIFGALLNRKTKKVEVKKSKFFVTSAIVSIVFIAVGAIYMLVDSVVNMFGVNGSDIKTSIVKFVILVLIVFISIIPLIIDFFKEFKNKKKPTSKVKTNIC